MSFGLESDRTVRDAVEAYLEGRRKPDLWGHVWFETRNGRYTLVDGVLVGAKAEALVGAELVGWLEDRNGERAVHARWAPGAKAVLVDRRAGKQLVVTSSVKRLGVDERDRANTTAPRRASARRAPSPGPTPPRSRPRRAYRPRRSRPRRRSPAACSRRPRRRRSRSRPCHRPTRPACRAPCPRRPTARARR